MLFLRFLQFYALILCIPALLNSNCILKMDKLSITEVNPQLAEAYANLVPFNETTNMINNSMRFKFEPDDSVLVSVASYRITKNNNTYPFMKFTAKLRDAFYLSVLQAETLRLKYTQPPINWPIQKDVTYWTHGYAPDASALPPSTPSGKLLTKIALKLKNNTIIFGSESLVTITYK